MRLLLVEDDIQIGSAIEQALKDSNYAVNWVQNGEDALVSSVSEKYDLVLLDLGLPVVDGFSVLKKIRDSHNQVPVVIITAKDELDKKIQGLDLGADDFLVKPFSIEELLARLRAVIRRHHGRSHSILNGEHFHLNTRTFEITKEGITVRLSAKEYALIHTLMLSPGKIFSREQIEDQLYGWNEEVNSNAIEFLIHGLRKKLGKESIINIRGLGWMIK